MSSNPGNAYLYNFGSSTQGALAAGAWLDLGSTTFTGTTTVASYIGSSGEFGFSVALNNNNVALIGATGVSTSRGNAYLFKLNDYSSSNVSTASIRTLLTSANVVILADDIIWVNSLLDLSSVSNANSLSLLSGGSIFINAAINLAAHPLIMIANAANSTPNATNPAATFTAANRTAGAANININAPISGSSSINASITSASASGRTGTYAQVGSITIGANSTLSASTITLNANEGAIVANSNLSASSATAGAITLSALTANLTNSLLNVPLGGSWLIYTTDTTSAAQNNIALGANSSAFARFSCTLSGGCTNGSIMPTSGNGVLAAWAPVITVSIPSISRVYDGTKIGAFSGVTITGAVTSGVFSNPVTLSSVSYTLSSANVGAYTTPTISSALSNTGLGYIVSYGATPTVTITPKALTITGTTANGKTYDGTITATATAGTLSGLVGTETITTTVGSATFADKNVGNGKVVTVAYTLGNGANGGLASNYSLADSSTTADIGVIGIAKNIDEFIAPAPISPSDQYFSLLKPIFVSVNHLGMGEVATFVPLIDQKELAPLIEISLASPFTQPLIFLDSVGR